MAPKHIDMETDTLKVLECDEKQMISSHPPRNISNIHE